MGYSLDQKINARQKYVESGKTYEQVAGETGISLSQLKIWGKEGNWTQEREDFERECLELHGNFQKLKLQLTREALQTGDPQKIYALATLHRATSLESRNGQVDKAALFLEWMGDLVDYLREKDQEALRYLQPHIRTFAETVKE